MESRFRLVSLRKRNYELSPNCGLRNFSIRPQNATLNSLMKKSNKSKGRKKRNAALWPQLTIERVLFDTETGFVKAVDLHDETTGKAYYCETRSSHFHGFNGKRTPTP